MTWKWDNDMALFFNDTGTFIALGQHLSHHLLSNGAIRNWSKPDAVKNPAANFSNSDEYGP